MSLLYENRKLPQQIIEEKRVNEALKRLILINDQQIRSQSRHFNTQPLIPYPKERCSSLDYFLNWSGQLVYMTHHTKYYQRLKPAHQLCSKRNKGDCVTNLFEEFGIKMESTRQKVDDGKGANFDGSQNSSCDISEREKLNEAKIPQMINNKMNITANLKENKTEKAQLKENKLLLLKLNDEISEDYFEFKKPVIKFEIFVEKNSSKSRDDPQTQQSISSVQIIDVNQSI